MGQVERAMEAASLGTPIVGTVQEDGTILLASPQILPSVFMLDDGTSRFSSVAPHIAIGHSGISADGRVLVAAAQRLAVEHAYTFDEPIPIDLFLEEMSLLMQEYTMKPATRPFGTILLIAYLPRQDYGGRPELFRIDPSGAVTTVEGNFAIINGKFSSEIQARIADLSRTSDDDDDDSTINDNDGSNNKTERRLRSLCEILQDAIMSTKSSSSTTTTQQQKDIVLPSTIIGASLTRQDGFQVKRWSIKKD